MIILQDPKFIKNYKKRISSNPKLVAHFKSRMRIFLEDPKHPLLKVHKLTGQLSSLNSLSITGDIRLIFERISDNEVVLYDIGTHNQVY